MASATPIKSPIEEAEFRGIGIGMVIAASIAAEHNGEQSAQHILRCASLNSFADVRAAGADPYDVKKLRFVLAGMEADDRVRHGLRGFALIDQLARGA